MQMIYRMLLGGAERGWQMHYLAVEPYRVRHANLHPHILPAPRPHTSLLFWGWFFVAAPLVALVLAWRHRVDELAVFEGAYAWTALPAKILLGRPLVVFLQSDVATINRMHGRPSLLRRAEQWMEGAGLRRADRIVCTNRALAEVVERRWRLAPAKLAVVANNVPAPPRVSGEARRRLASALGLPEGAFVVATSGVFAPRKNLDLLLQSFAELRSPRAQLVVIGAGTDAAVWERTTAAARRGPNGSRIHFLGWRSDVVEILAGCDLFVFPSRHEGSPLSLIEALRVGLPCLGSDIDEIREVLGDEPACLFDPDDAAALRARIERAADDEEFLGRLRRHAAERAGRYEFDWEAAVTELMSSARGSAPAAPAQPAADADPAPDAAPSSLVVRLYETATGMRATPRSAATVSRFGPYLAGMMAAKVLSTLGQLLLSRILGPSELGRLAVVLSVSTLLALPLAGAWGSAFVRYAAAQPRSIWAPLLRWASGRVLLTAVGLAAGLTLAAPLLGAALDVPASLLVAGGGLGIAMASWLLAKAACQGRENWGRFVGSELVFGSLALLLPSAMLLLGGSSWGLAALVFLAAYALATIPAWSLLAQARSAPDDAVVPSSASHYGRFALYTGAANALFLYGDRFAAQHVLGFAEVGVYQVYSFATVGVAMLLSTLLYNFAFPLFPQGDRRAFAAVFLAGFVRLLPLTLIALFAGGAAQVWLTGFPFRPGLLALATTTAAAFLLSGFYGHLVLSLGVSGSQLAARVALATLAVFAVGIVPAVRLGGLGGLFLLYAGIYLGVAAYYLAALRRLEPDGVAAEGFAR